MNDTPYVLVNPVVTFASDLSRQIVSVTTEVESPPDENGICYNYEVETIYEVDELSASHFFPTMKPIIILTLLSCTRTDTREHAVFSPRYMKALREIVGERVYTHFSTQYENF